MAVNEEVSAYSTTAASNDPAGSATVGPDLDNHLRDMKKNIRAVGQTFLGSSEGNFDGALKVDNSASPTWTLGITQGGSFINLMDIDVSANTSTPYAGSNTIGTFAQDYLQEGTASARDTIMGTVLGPVAAEDSTASAQLAFGIVSATTTVAGLVEKATQSEIEAGTADKFVEAENLAAALGFTQFFESSEQTVSADTQLDVAHGLGATPKLVQVILHCDTDDAGYSAGDEVVYMGSSSQGGLDRGADVSVDATNVTIITGVILALLGKSTFNSTALTLANWRWIVRAWA